MTKSLFYNTLVVSIVVQIITGLIEIGAFFVKVPTAYLIIKQLLALELLVQSLEGAFYFWLVYNFPTAFKKSIFAMMASYNAP